MKNRLKLLLKENKIRISKLSKELNMSRTTLTTLYYEKDSIPRLEIVLKICDYFGCSLDYFLKRSDEVNNNHLKEKIAQSDFKEKGKNYHEKNN